MTTFTAMPKYEAYNDSGIDWLGEIPEHWGVVRLKSLSLVKRGASPRPIDSPKYFSDKGEFSWVRISDVTASNHFLYETSEKLSKLGASYSVKLQPGSLFLSIAGSVGKPIITKIKCCIHDGFVYFPTLNINVEFVFRLFESGQPFNGLGKHGTQLNLNTDTVGNIYIGLPSLKEQTAIANFLDEKTAKIDEAIAIKEQQIELLKERKQIIIQQAVTQGLDPTVPMKDSGVEWIGKIPAHWEMKPLKLHLKKIIDNRGRTPAFGDNGIPMLEVKNITDGDLYPTEQFDKFVIPSVVEKYERDKVAIGDVLISTVGATSGKTVLIKNSPTYFICQNVVGLRPDIDLGSEFLNYTLSAVYFKTSLQMINKGNTVSAAHRLDLKN